MTASSNVHYSILRDLMRVAGADGVAVSSKLVAAPPRQSSHQLHYPSILTITRPMSPTTTGVEEWDCVRMYEVDTL